MGRGDTFEIFLPPLKWHNYAGGKTESGNFILRARISGCLHVSSEQYFFSPSRRWKQWFLWALIIGVELPELKPWAMCKNRNYFSGMLLNVAQKLPTFLILLSPILQCGSRELSLHNQSYTQKYLFWQFNRLRILYLLSFHFCTAQTFKTKKPDTKCWALTEYIEFSHFSLGTPCAVDFN